MIYSIDVNPKLCVVYSEDISAGTVNDFDRPLYLLGSMGMTASDLLSRLNEKCVVLTFLGGLNGERLQRLFKSNFISYNVLEIRDETPNKYIFGNGLFKTVVNEPKSKISIGEYEAFLDLCSKQFSVPGNVLMISERDFSEQQFKMFADVARKSKQNGCDLYIACESEFTDSLPALAPKVFVVGAAELGTYYKVEFDYESEVIRILKGIAEHGISYAATKYKENIIVVSADCGYRVSSQSANLEQMYFSSSAMAMGLAIANERNLSIQTAILFAAALGLSPQLLTNRDEDENTVKEIMRNLKIERFNL